MTHHIWHMPNGVAWTFYKISALYLYWFGSYDVLKISLLPAIYIYGVCRRIANQILPNFDILTYEIGPAEYLRKLNCQVLIKSRQKQWAKDFFLLYILKTKLTHDTWHMTHDIWHVTNRVCWKLSQNLRSLALTVREY